MTSLTDLCAAVVEDGATSCVAVDAQTGQIVSRWRGGDGGERPEGDAPRDILLGRRPVDLAFAKQSVELPIDVAKEGLIVGKQRATFVYVSSGGRWCITVVTPRKTSVAIGWSLLRRVSVAVEAMP
jgi:hypothetical protein